MSQILSGIESYVIGRALERNKGNRHETARLLGLELAVLERKLTEYGLSDA